ncbi:hypothetical protein M9H77_01152 [Catharanthus roseus]|uniref:Uncharacterized protein n=1 Tax=Catharanthus roseus TaxID=4058 RepID=A0ACC0C4P9_CATRO|nr:hypothetical protein M9H77_01152 [Catharanthus roseus]
MSTPPPCTWLPPLNSHENIRTTMSLEEAPEILHTTPDSAIFIIIKDSHSFQLIPTITTPGFAVDVIFTVNFISNSNNVNFPGLSLKQRFAFPCDALLSSNFYFILFHKITRIMLDYTTEFPIKLGSSIYFQEPYNNNNNNNNKISVQRNNATLSLKIREILKKLKVGKFLSDFTTPVRWKIVKNVVISDEEYEAWNSWYKEKKRADPSFENQYTESISRPRTLDQVMNEEMMKFKAATTSSIQGLEVVKIVEDDSTSITKNCLICLDDFELLESEVAKLPCSHVFHKGCVSKWLQQSHMCPLCRFPLPTPLDN